jgi:glycosyltransferase involved in cell wall biosynthesis
MLKNKTIAVIVPAYNEELCIEAVIKSMPVFVDRIIVIDDGSEDATAEVVKKLMVDKSMLLYEPSPRETIIKCKGNDLASFPSYTLYTCDNGKGRLILLSHTMNSGKGAGIKTGYAFASSLGIDCIATMDGDGQMNPDELINICLPVIQEEADYVKGDRLSHPKSMTIIPPIRLVGNTILSLLTKPASGFWNVQDTQTGFTAISKKAVNKIPLHDIFTYYGYPNDILVKLNIENLSIKEIPVTPVYQEHHKSKMKMHLVIPKISGLLIKSFFKRIAYKYFINSMHPLFFLFCINITVLLIWMLSSCFEDLKPLEHFYFGFAFITGSLIATAWDIKLNASLYK